ncbi:hypothetical protein KKF84_04595 [Myxococcota bacterium]|nr:hypothetical protein [Myxococcota bacterium]MBU1534575.1 hypothetical protein [Myxococcota bacterium]
MLQAHRTLESGHHDIVYITAGVWHNLHNALNASEDCTTGGIILHGPISATGFIAAPCRRSGRDISMKQFLLIFLISWAVAACDETVEVADACGDEVLDLGEECDGGAFGGSYCQLLGYYGGRLTCTDQCSLDLSLCLEKGFCGDGVIQGDNESCDGDNIADTRCSAIGYPSGELSCADNCRYNISGCEGGDLCGDGVIQTPEECDGNALGGTDCTMAGDYLGGTLACGSDCRFDTSRCYREVVCGDGVIQGDEECDSENTSGITCGTLGYTGGSLRCVDCAFDLSECQGEISCGDGVKNGFEECDGTDLGGASCDSAGFSGGSVSCDGECRLVWECEQTEAWIAVNAGMRHTCAVTGDYRVFCWGDGAYGQLGTGDASPVMIPVAVPMGGVGATAVRAGGMSTCALSHEGQAYCWGSFTSIEEATPMAQPLPPGETWSHLSIYYNNTGFALDSQGSAWTFNMPGAPVAVPMPADRSFTTIAAGMLHRCALDDMGNAWCWGSNTDSQLGDGTTTTASTPIGVLMPSQRLFWGLSTGREHSCAIDDLGNAWCWGKGSYYRLGNGEEINQSTPEPVTMPPERTFDSISAGEYHTCAIDDLGNAWCWGHNGEGQAGVNSTTNVPSPTAVVMPPGVTFTGISAGTWHTCALDNLGSLWCWGCGDYGKLGSGDLEQSNIPRAVLPPAQ